MVNHQHMTSLTPGQRWISDTETEQGIGTILSLDGRLVTILFPATEEMRTYSINNSPLTRVSFSPGDKIESKDGLSMTVTEVTSNKDLITYTGILDNGQIQKIDEINLSDTISFNKPQDKLLAGQIDKNSNYTLRYKTLLHNHQLYKSSARGLIGPRASLIPHQLHIARKVSNRYAPRVMLADEVGMGKTIEAGMILHQQLITGRATRALILVPSPLLHQWVVEMLRRFNLHFSIFDEDRCQNIVDNNPFVSEQLAICSIDFLCNNEYRLQQALTAKWDLMIVDEAHHLVWSSKQPSAEYSCIDKLATQIPGLLLLTATPEQMGIESHFARLRLLDPNRFHDLSAFQEENRSYEPVAKAVRNILNKSNLSDQTKNNLINYLGDNCRHSLHLLEQGTSKEQMDSQEYILRQLLDRHGTGRILFRNTRTSVGGFPQRAIHEYPLSMPPLFLTALKEEAKAQIINNKLNICPEIAYQTHIKGSDIKPWWTIDPRCKWLIQLLASLKKQKVLVICANTSTSLDLAEAMRILSGIATATFHEGMSIVERDRAAAWFADTIDGVQIMICSEIGSEGRNFQFAHHLVLFDLPKHPDLLEQRIGRLDRIGQTETIQIHVPYIEKSGQEILFHWYHEALDAFAKTCPAGSSIYQTLELELQQLLDNCTAVSKSDLQPLLNKASILNQELKEHMQNGRDLLLELNSRGLSSNEDIINDIEEQEEPHQLKQYLETLFESFGVDIEDHSKQCLVLSPGSHMITAIPGLPVEGTTVTFNRETALSREDMQFLTWEHPMVSGVMDMVLTTGIGTTSVVLLNNKAIKFGSLFIETIYILEALGEKSLQLNRYLPTTPIRSLIDSSMNNLAEKVSFDTLNSQVMPIKKGIARKLIKAQRETILKMLPHAEASLKGLIDKITSKASQQLHNDVTAEIERLTALKAVNATVREDEIQHLKHQATHGYKLLKKPTLRLDAIRILIAS